MSDQQDIASILNPIAHQALKVVHADSIVIFRYDAKQGFSAVPIVSGELASNCAEGGMTAIEGSVKDFILQAGSAYLKSEKEYLQLLKKVGIAIKDRNLPAAHFWHREKIESAVLLRLAFGTESVGVMSINYCSKQDFNPPAKEVIEFAAQFVAYGMINNRLLAENHTFWETYRADSLSLSVSEIVTSLAHNSGNLLSSINMRFGKLHLYLKRNADKPLERNKIESLIDGIAAPLDELTQDFERLKDYRRLDRLNVQRCDINELVRESVHLLRSKFEHQRTTVIERLSNNLRPVRCDRSQVQHVLLNLFLNAAEALGNKGTVSIETNLSNDGDFVCTKITDTGKGIPSQFGDKIFEPFFSTKMHPAGWGMGLPISRYIVISHGGKIEFTSTPGKGTSFLIYLPVG